MDRKDIHEEDVPVTMSDGGGKRPLLSCLQDEFILQGDSDGKHAAGSPL